MKRSAIAAANRLENSIPMFTSQAAERSSAVIGTIRRCGETGTKRVIAAAMAPMSAPHLMPKRASLSEPAARLILRRLCC
jgi:hypothetical protein